MCLGDFGHTFTTPPPKKSLSWTSLFYDYHFVGNPYIDGMAYLRWRLGQGGATKRELVRALHDHPTLFDRWLVDVLEAKTTVSHPAWLL